MNKPKAIVLTENYLDTSFAKTCHGLLRGTERFDILAVIEEKYAGQDAGIIMDGQSLGIPIFSNVDAFLAQNVDKPTYCIVGVATPGGIMPDNLKNELKKAIRHQMHIVNGLHNFLSEDPEFVALAEQYQVQLIDVRKPKPRNQLHFWEGEIYNIKTPVIAVIGTDCALGKRTTCRFLMEMCSANGVKAEMIYTGQTGWMQGSPYGFILDSTVNDFVGGEIEKAIVECSKNLNPDVIFLEGQSALLNPSGPCGSEFLLSGNAKGVILQHAPGRKCYIDTPKPMDPIEKHIALIELYGAKVLALTLNGEELTEGELINQQVKLNKELQLPVVRPLQEGVEGLLPIIKQYITQ